MTTKIVYIHPGDMLDVRIVRPAYGDANARTWKSQPRPGSALVTFRDHCTMLVVPMLMDVYGGTSWENARQYVPFVYKSPKPPEEPTGWLPSE